MPNNLIFRKSVCTIVGVLVSLWVDRSEPPYLGVVHAVSELVCVEPEGGIVLLPLVSLSQVAIIAVRFHRLCAQPRYLHAEGLPIPSHQTISGKVPQRTWFNENMHKTVHFSLFFYSYISKKLFYANHKKIKRAAIFFFVR